MVRFTTPTIYILIKILLQQHLGEILQKKQIIFNLKNKGTTALLRKPYKQRIKKVKTSIYIYTSIYVKTYIKYILYVGSESELNSWSDSSVG